MALLAIAGFTYILFSSLTDENACARGESAACVHFQPSRNHPMVSRSP
jgi:hypothetical protein